MIKCIVCDLDGTLLNEANEMESQTYKLLKQSIAKGIEFIIATGRDINLVIDLFNQYDLNCELILNNGAQYCNREMSFNEIYPMDNDAFIKVATILNNYGYLLAIHTNKGMYSLLNKEQFWKYHSYLLKKTHPDIIAKTTFTTKDYLRTFHYAPSPESIINQGIKVLKIDARHYDINSIQGVRKLLDNEQLDISSSFEDNIEITSKISNKGLMVRKVIEKKGYTKNEVAVFGDGENDCPMLASFTYSFAPKNACLKAKELARYHLNKTGAQGAVGEGITLLYQQGLIKS